MLETIKLVLFVILLWFASYYGKQGALLPIIWWVIAVVIVLLMVYDVFKSLKKVDKK